MAKGYLCPYCNTYTLQRVSENWYECSKCSTRASKETVQGS